MITAAGPVTGLRIDTTTTVSVDQNQNASTTQSSRMSFRINNQLASIKSKHNLTNGDLITAAGIMRSAELDVVAYKNHTTNTIHWVTALPLWIGIAVTLLGFITLGILIGWLILPVGIFYMIRDGVHHAKVKQAMALIQNAPAPAGV